MKKPEGRLEDAEEIVARWQRERTNDVQTEESAGGQTDKGTDVQPDKNADVRTRRGRKVRTHKRPEVRTHKQAKVQARKPAGGQTDEPPYGPKRGLHIEIPKDFRKHWKIECEKIDRTVTDVVMELMTEKFGLPRK